MDNLIKKMTVVIFLAITFSFPVLSLKTARDKVSAIENRNLNGFPKIEKKVLLGEKFYSDINLYLVDHLYGRGFWFKEFSKFSLNVLKKDRLQNVVIGKDGVLLRYYEYADFDSKKSRLDTSLEKDAVVINRLGDFVTSKGKTFFFVGVPYQNIIIKRM